MVSDTDIALFLLLLGVEPSSALLNEMDEAELEKYTFAMSRLEKINIDRQLELAVAVLSYTTTPAFCTSLIERGEFLSLLQRLGEESIQLGWRGLLDFFDTLGPQMPKHTLENVSLFSQAIKEYSPQNSQSAKTNEEIYNDRLLRAVETGTQTDLRDLRSYGGQPLQIAFSVRQVHLPEHLHLNPSSVMGRSMSVRALDSSWLVHLDGIPSVPPWVLELKDKADESGVEYSVTYNTLDNKGAISR